MISKRIHCQAGNDNYGRLASYIADASHQGEKSLISWCAGCWAGDDYELAMREVADTQALNTRSQGVKTYHLVVSFRPEDEAVLTPEKFKAIEERFAEALGLADHQRHCGVHINTENMHMHVAYNLIHPEKLTRVEPWRDYIKRDKLCRELEREYGLVLDNGRDKAPGHSLGDKAAGVEAHTGLQSFESYARDQGDAIVAALADAKTWEDAHVIFARHGLSLQPRGAGLVVKNRHGRHTATTVKISKHGSVIYTLPTGDKISDTGKSISFSAGARETALAYMAAKWGERRRAVDRPTGNAVFILSSGQRVVLEPGKNCLERPPARPHVLKQRRSGISR